MKEITVAYGSSVADSLSGSALFSSTMTIGPANPNKIVFVGVFNNDSRSSEPTAVTVGGISATKIGVINNGSGTYIQLWTVPITTGTTATVTVQTQGTVDAFAVATYYATNVSAVPVSLATSTAAPGTGNVIIPTPGFAIGLGMSGAASGSPTATWTNATENFDALRASGTATTYSGALTTLPDGNGIDITCTWTNTTTGGRAFLAASFG